MINVKSSRGFAGSVEGERSDSSVNQGGKITSNLYICIHTFKLFLVCVFFLTREQFSKRNL